MHKTYIVDIDGTICTQCDNYAEAQPRTERIGYINQLYDLGNTIIYWTGRGSKTGIDYSELTKQQLDFWGCKYTQLKMLKPAYDEWIDDKATNSEDFFK